MARVVATALGPEIFSLPVVQVRFQRSRTGLSRCVIHSNSKRTLSSGVALVPNGMSAMGAIFSAYNRLVVFTECRKEGISYAVLSESHLTLLEKDSITTSNGCGQDVTKV